MAAATAVAAALVTMEPPQPPTHRVSVTCDRHPDESFTGFCTSCLRERLSNLESATCTTHRNSTSTISSSLKSIFYKPSTSSSLQPDLRRCKSFSFSAPRLSNSFEPKRHSCDIRARNTLWSLFNQDDDTTKILNGAHSLAAAAASNAEIEVVVDDEITVVDPLATLGTSCEIQPEEKPMKDHIDLESQTKKPPPTAGSFWLAASVFSKKLQKWRRKQKLKKMKKQEDKADQKSSTRFRETQSEIAIDAFGRRSLDLDPRFSLDAGRISFEDQRYSFDEPRASWDSYLLGARSVFSRPPPMLSVVEDAASPVIQRTDGEIPVEEDITVPGGSMQMKDYYCDSFSRSQRRSLDRSSSVRRLSVEVNEANLVSNAKVLPTGSGEFSRDWSSNSLRDDRSESFESGFRDASSQKLPPRKKSKRWSKAWSIWGFIIHRRSGSQGGGNVVDRSFSESWSDLRGKGYHANGRMLRSDSSVSSRSSIYGNSSFGSMRRNGLTETNRIGKKRRDEIVLERNRSARYSPGHADNGMLRFYLTPMRGSRKGCGKGKHNNSNHSFARSVLQLY